jgi:nicotinate dehydrogenase subunit A
MSLQTITFFLNDEQVSVEAREDTSLLQAVRDHLGFLGTRIGCTEGYCGACTVWIDGRAVQSCNTPLWSAQGKSITTIEYGDKNHWIATVQSLFLEEQAAQCGYCSNGLIMALAGLMMHPVVLTRDAIVHHLDERHLCRCGVHIRVLRVIDRLLEKRQSGEAS